MEVSVPYESTAEKGIGGAVFGSVFKLGKQHIAEAGPRASRTVDSVTHDNQPDNPHIPPDFGFPKRRDGTDSDAPSRQRG